MSVGILLITHPGAGQALLAVAERLLGRMPLAVSCFEVDYDTEFSDLIAAASTALRALDQRDGVLLLNDLYGASPSNFSVQVEGLGIPTRRVSGLNLPMLLRALNYADSSLDELADKAAAGGKLGVVVGRG